MASNWQRSWLGVALALGMHVVDEAMHSFLDWYNPIADSLQVQLGIPFPPTFTFPIWLGGLTLLVLTCVAVTPFFQPRRRWLVPIAVAWGVIHTGNGLLHIIASINAGRMVPGTWTAPLLLLTAPYLILESLRVRRPRAEIRETSA